MINDLHIFNTKKFKAIWIYESTEGNGVQKQIHRNFHALHYGRRTLDISNKVKIYHSEELWHMQLQLPLNAETRRD